MKNNNFNFFVKAEADSNGKKGKYDNMFLFGEASNNTKDSDEEILEPSGYIIDNFIKNGTLNYEHQAKNSSRYIVGEPVQAEIKNNRFFIKGKLWKGCEVAQDLWDTLHVMKENNSNRTLGWSIEGKAISRDPANPKRIIKALITNCALTFSPKNKNTWAQIAKGEYKDAYIEPEFDETANGGSEYLLDITKPDGTHITIDKEFNIKIGKAMTAGTKTGRDLDGTDTSGAALKKESLGKKLIDLKQDIVKNFVLKAQEKKKEGKFNKEQLEKVKKIIKNFFV